MPWLIWGASVLAGGRTWGYLVSGQSWLPGWGRRERFHYALEAFLLCCSMCWERHALKTGAPRTLGWSARSLLASRLEVWQNSFGIRCVFVEKEGKRNPEILYALLEVFPFLVVARRNCVSGVC